MRGALITALSSPPEVTDLDDVDGVRIEAVALNPLDVNVGSGRFYGGHPPLPYVPGCEAVGRRDDDAAVYLFGEGRGVARDGFLAERVAVPAELPLEPPAGTDPALGAVAGVAGIAGWVPVAWKARVGPGDRVLVLSRAGRQGRSPSRQRSCSARKRWSGPAARQRRASSPSTTSPTPSATTASRSASIQCGASRSHACSPRRRATRGSSTSVSPPARKSPLRSADVRGKELTILGHSNFAMTAEERNRAYLELLDHLVAGRIEIALERYPLDRAAEAWERQSSGPGGKVVVEL
jgi:NADPH:quinone reductase